MPYCIHIQITEDWRTCTQNYCQDSSSAEPGSCSRPQSSCSRDSSVVILSKQLKAWSSCGSDIWRQADQGRRAATPTAGCTSEMVITSNIERKLDQRAEFSLSKLRRLMCITQGIKKLKKISHSRSSRSSRVLSTGDGHT